MSTMSNNDHIRNFLQDLYDDCIFEYVRDRAPDAFVNYKQTRTILVLLQQATISDITMYHQVKMQEITRFYKELNE